MTAQIQSREKRRFRAWAAIVIVSVTAGCGARHAGPDFRKPLFTAHGATLCRTRRGLDLFLQHLRAGETPNIMGAMELGCIMLPAGQRVLRLKKIGIFDVWLKVALRGYGRNAGDFWVPGWMLRN